MAKYRIKQKGEYFYPQKNNKFETFWCWVPLYRKSYDQYKDSMSSDMVRAFFKTLDEASDFIEEYRKKHEVKIYTYLRK